MSFVVVVLKQGRETDCLYSRSITTKAVLWLWVSFGNDLKSIVICCQRRFGTSNGHNYLGVQSLRAFACLQT